MQREWIGRIAGLSNQEYHASPGISKSGLDLIAKSPEHFRESRRAPREQTAAMRIGAAFHKLTLEPVDFDAEFAIGPDCAKRSKVEKQTWKNFESASAGKTILTVDEYRKAADMADAVRSKTLSAALLEYKGETETSFYWQHESGVLCKCRPDYLRADGWIVDLKSTTDASPNAFMRSAETYRYYVQAAYYKRGVEVVTGEQIKGFIFVAVEKEPPYAVACYKATDDMIHGGHIEAARCLSIYKQCLDTDEWPGYPEEIIPLDRPHWAA